MFDVPKPIMVRRRSDGQWQVILHYTPTRPPIVHPDGRTAIEHAALEADEIRRQRAWVVDADVYRSSHRQCAYVSRLWAEDWDSSEDAVYDEE